MKQINTAMDILSDPEKKKMYDMGIDPNNPINQNQNDQQHVNFGDFGGGFTGFNGFGGTDFAEFITKMMSGQNGNFKFGKQNGNQKVFYEFRK